MAAKGGFAFNSIPRLRDSQLRANLKSATTAIRNKRAGVVGEKPDWEELRCRGEAIKNEVLDNLDKYLVELEESVTQAGGHVHWAGSATEANELVLSIVRGHGKDEVIKVKSLTTDEMGLNGFLAKNGVTARETDLAELIVQLAHDRPSHILVPAIHKNRAEIKELFEKTISTHSPLSDSPADLAETSRLFLREKFLTTDIAVSGVNFAVAETGTVCVVESEGNGRMCLTLPSVLISVMGIEKVIPNLTDLEVFLELLPRSSTGERMNPYTSLWTGIHPGDGPKEFHLVIMDNRRTSVLADPIGREALRCIRCSACLNVCPVYERAGGHAYDSVYPGPIGAVVSPQLFETESALSLPWASTLCGACYEVCPVRIDIPRLLVHLRERLADRQKGARSERAGFSVMAAVFRYPEVFDMAERVLAFLRIPLRGARLIRLLPGPLGAWAESREIPDIPVSSFRETWRSSRNEKS